MGQCREAIILAGSLGKRMGNQDIPKWLTPIGSTTIAQLQVSWLHLNGIERVLVTLNKRYEFATLGLQIGEFQSTWEGQHLYVKKTRDAPVEFLWEENPIGDEGGLKRALKHLEGDEALVCNCDILTDLPLSALPPAPALVVVHPRSPWGVLREKIDFDGRGQPHQYTFFEEKPILPIWVSAGIYRFPKAIRDELVDEGELARNIVPKLFREGRLNILKYEGRWHACETPKDIEDAKEFVEHA